MKKIRKKIYLYCLVSALLAVVIGQIDLIQFVNRLAPDGKISGGLSPMINFLPFYFIIWAGLFLVFANFHSRIKQIIHSSIHLVKNWKAKRFLFFVILLGVLIRLFWVISIENKPFSDAHWFNETAINISETGTFQYENKETAYRPIGYPAVLSGIYFLFGYSLLYAKLLNLLLFIGIILVSYFLFKTHFGEFPTRITLIVYSILPSSIAFTGLTMSEPLFTFFLLSALLSINGKKAYLAGILSALTILVRPIALPIIFIIALFKRNWKFLLIQVSITFLILLPWGIRNYRLFQSFVPVSTNGGVNLYIGNNPRAKGTYTNPVDVFAQNEAESSSFYTKMAIDYILNNPVETILRMPRKLFYLYAKDNVAIDWTFHDESERSLLQGLLHLASFTLYYSILILGFLEFIKRPKDWEFWLIIYFTVFYIIFGL